MTALVAADVTITVNERQIVGKKRRNRVTIAFGDAALTYPSGGVPLPAFGSWGMTRNLDWLTVFDEDDASGVVWKYDRTNNKLRGYVQGVNVASNVAADTKFEATAVANSLAAIRFTITCADLVTIGSSGAARTGVLQELGTTQAPPAATLQGEAVGW